ncbi:hypothetical protein HRR83_000570 [Exophiala dermatitidis]|uniref:Armadillo-like helical domain-containing protein n=2 Tax=Exophiala dermatitidis TaxID=5970 RepID=H6C9Z2_EXODN|nr:uncharacterized protein HMPREF1120_08747 [Exophiala dermatitidis NIH/UT8656]KAJ4527816.1 hypothetical protein HRR74_000571 [Exophiala dermatitidis]EHY60803.1 hypothetical protein HMPREF1120_08747 [Exophiala dermatitidis NIH/UT8656]KAJ4528452.1 hypothetical protein HRR73_001075 [Exophiala dermatitidis]KAJ4531413.1 hypothetical protein HRR76_009070 [Exophiala dermatitidis]KAJ4558574.1 hypothetical protein HRR77_000570 [Exophiala dermatitidis]
MDSPLTQLLRPDSFEPKIVQLYLHLFNVLANDDGDDVVPSEGFWREFFLLKPDKQRLYDILAPMTAFDLLQLQSQTQAFFNRAVMEAGSGIAPGSENALENLTAFLCAVFTKKYTNPNTDVIEVLAGLDSIDRLMSDLVQTLESIIRQGDNETIRRSALHATLALVAGGFHTSLVSYFMHRDLFSALMKYIHDVQTNPADGLDAAVVIGILSSYNKFESQNVYHNRLADFVNEDSIKLLVDKFATACVEIRDQYVAVQDDYPASWSISNTLAMVGFRGLSSNAKKPLPPSEEDAKRLFASLPKKTAACLLSLYSFVSANKLFAANLVNVPAHKDKETPLAAFLSSTSYVSHHAYRGPRQSTYATLSLLSIRILVEDSVLVKRICSADSKTVVRLCRQRPPHLPLITSSRVPAAAILDICTDTLSHNLRKRLDVHLYGLALGIMLRIVTYLEQSKTRLHHHWAYIWGSLLSLMRFLTQYSEDLRHLRGVREELCGTLASLAAFCLSKGDSFLPDPASFDDLFYKLIEANDVLPRFKQAYCDRSPQSDVLNASVDALINVSSHYHGLLNARQGKKTHQSPAAIQKVIKEGYETLSLESDEGVGHWERWRETNWKSELKKMIRITVEDSRLLSLKR